MQGRYKTILELPEILLRDLYRKQEVPKSAVSRVDTFRFSLDFLYGLDVFATSCWNLCLGPEFSMTGPSPVAQSSENKVLARGI